MKQAAQERLPHALSDAIDFWPGERVIRLRRLELDITLDAAFEPEVFAALLSRAIAVALRRVEARGFVSDETIGVMCFPSRSLYVAALIEALAEGRIAQCWWLRDADGLRFLPPGTAIRTALLADAAVGLEAVLTLPGSRLARVLRVLSGIEAARLLDSLARAGRAQADAVECAAAIAKAGSALPVESSPLELFLHAAAGGPAMAGPSLAEAARLWVEAARETSEMSPQHRSQRPSTAAPMDTALVEPASKPLESPDVALVDAVARELRNAAPTRNAASTHTSFGGLLLLLPDLGFAEIARAVEGQEETARLAGYAALGLCAGRDRYARYLADPLWRELFGLDLKAPVATIAAQLATIGPDAWSALAPLGAPIGRQRDARFLLAPRALAGSRAAAHTVAGLALAALSRFARRLIGFRNASAPFLWANLLSVEAVLERRGNGWTARLGRPPLDVLLSLSRLAEGSVVTPSGARVALARVAA